MDINKFDPHYCKAELVLNEACDPHRAAEGLFNHHRPLLTKLTRSACTVRAMHPQPNLATWKGGRVSPAILLTPIGSLAGADAASVSRQLSPSCGHVVAAHIRQSARLRSRRFTADHRTRNRNPGRTKAPSSTGAKTCHASRVRARTRGGSKIMHARAYCWRQGPASPCA